MSSEVLMYILAIIPGVILICASDIRGTCAGIAEISVALIHPWPWCYVGMFCLIPLVFMLGKFVV